MKPRDLGRAVHIAQSVRNSRPVVDHDRLQQWNKIISDDPSAREQRSTEQLAQLLDRDYNLYADTEPPNKAQLEYANQFFQPNKHSPVNLWTSDVFRTIPESNNPEIAFVGRTNTGKSSLINALVGKKVCQTSMKWGKTTQFYAYGVGGKKGGDSRFTLIDLPGYGKASNAKWGEEITKYFEKRKQLRRVMVLIDPKHSVKETDVELLTLLRTLAVPHQVILTKADMLLIKGGKGKSRGFNQNRLNEFLTKRNHIRNKIDNLVPEGPGMLRDFLAVSAKFSRTDRTATLGLDPLRWAILRAAGLDTIPLRKSSSSSNSSSGESSSGERSSGERSSPED